MEALEETSAKFGPALKGPHTINATLYEVIETVHETIEPGEGALVVPVILDLIQSGILKGRSPHRRFWAGTVTRPTKETQ
jgi:hypothetical protein